MKKLFSLIIACVLLCGMLVSCGAPNNTDAKTNTGTSESTNSDSSASSGSNEGTQESDTQKVPFSNVTFVNKEHSYYTTLNNVVYIGNAFPDEDGIYIKMIESKDELYCEGLEFDNELFQYNDILAVNIHKSFTPSNYKLIGCYGLECIDSKYSLSLDYYGQIEGDNVILPIYGCVAVDYNFVVFFVIPKGEIDIFEGVKEVTIKDNLVNLGNDFEYSFAKHYKTPSSSQDTMVIPVTTQNREELISKYSLAKNINAGDLLVYLPFEMQGDMLLKEVYVNGNTIEIVFDNYKHVENAYIEQNDARYYLISHFNDFEKIPEDYDINITINVLYVPTVSFFTSYESV